MRSPRALLSLALALAALFAAPLARGTALYVNRTVVVEPGDVRLGDLVQSTGEVPAGADAALARTVATVSRALLVLPARGYAALLEQAFGADCILVGSRTLVIPRGLLSEERVRLFDELADFLRQQGVLGEERSEIEIVQTLGGGVSAGSPAFFRLTRSVKGAGAREVTCSVSPSAAEPAIGSITLRVRETLPAAEGVKASDRVQVLFRKGAVTVEMQGKALASAGPGASVSVYVPDSLRSFSGRVIGKKAVEVELP
jgi:hypothetical protein